MSWPLFYWAARLCNTHIRNRWGSFFRTQSSLIWLGWSNPIGICLLENWLRFLHWLGEDRPCTEMTFQPVRRECLLHLLMQDIWKKNYVAETHCFNWIFEFLVEFAIFLRNLVIVSIVKVLNLKSKSLNFNLKNICKQTLKSTFTILDSRYKKLTLQQIIIQIPSRYNTYDVNRESRL